MQGSFLKPVLRCWLQLQDHSVLQYGAIQQQEASAGLHAMDRHDFDPEQPCSAVNDQPEPFSGDSRRNDLHAGVCTDELPDL